MFNNSKRILSILMSVIMIVTSAVSAAVSSGAVEEITAAFESTSKETTGNYYPDETTASTVPDTGVTYPSTHPGTTTASTDGQPLLGDVDGDGYTTSADARIICRESARVERLNDSLFYLADLVPDGTIRANDARLALRISSNLDTIDGQAPVRTFLDKERSDSVKINAVSTDVSYVGDEITVTISADNLSGTENGNIFFNYDASVLEYICIYRTEDVSCNMSSGDKIADGLFSWAFFYLNAAKADSGLAVLRFKVLTDVKETTINYTIGTWDGTAAPRDGVFTIPVITNPEPTTARPPETTTDTPPVTRPPLTVPPETTTAPNTSVVLSSTISELKNISVGDEFEITFSAKNLSNIYYAYFDVNVDSNYLKITGATRPESAQFGEIGEYGAGWGFWYDLLPGYCESIFCTVTFEAIKAGTTEIRFSAKTGSKTATTLDVTELTEILVINERTSEETTTAERTTIDKTTTTERTTHYNETTTGSGTTDGGLDPHPGVNIIIFNFTAIIGSGITPDDFRNNVYNNIVTILSSDGKVLDDTLFIGTGCTICICDAQGNILFRYDVSVSYDINGDGKITAADARLALRAAAKIDTLDGVYAMAADVNDDGKITAMDARTILRKAAGLE